MPGVRSAISALLPSSILAADPVDEFLEGAGSATRLGERLELIGLTISLPALLLAIGLALFVWFVVRAPRRGELGLLLRAAGLLGGLTMVGAFVELVGTVTILGDGWFADLADPIARGGLFRLAAGGLLLTALALGEPKPGEPKVRLVGWLLFAGSCFGLASLALDGHTVTEGTLWLQVLMSSLHVIAASMWAGGILGLVLMSRRRRRLQPDVSMLPTVARFSSIATLVVVTVAAGGVGMALQIVNGVADLFTTPWGRLLVAKVALVLFAIGIAGYNRFSLLPRMENDRAIANRLRVSITVEFIVLASVAVTTVFLVSASIN
jgi:copper transport protein